MRRRRALLLLACGLQWGCSADDSALDGDDGPQDSDALAQSLSEIGSPAAASEQDLVIEAPVGTKYLRMLVTAMSGPGCVSTRTTVRSGTRPTNIIDIGFDETAFIAATDPSKGLTDVTVKCQLELRIRGAKGHQSIVHQLDYRGNSNIPFGAVGTIESSVQWRDDKFGTIEDGRERKSLRGPWTGTWFMNHTPARSAAARSKCYASDSDEDIIYIETSLRMQSTSQVAFLTMTYAGGSSFTDDGAPVVGQPSRELPPISLQIEAEPCTP